MIQPEPLKLHFADFGTEEEQAVLEVLRSGWLTRGPKTSEFEQAFAARVKAPHTLGVNSCTAALHLAMLVGGVGSGDEVIVPALTFAASANVVVHCGASPVFADVLPGTQCVDPASVAALITERTKALVVVHFAGIPAELDELRALAEQHGLFIIEDCAHAVEAEYHGQPVGVGGGGVGGARFAAYSFYATKNLITGEGGMLACSTEADREHAAVLGLHGMSADAWRRYHRDDFALYDIVAAGFKYNMFDLQAALGLVQLAKLDANWELRRARVEQYLELLGDEARVSALTYPSDVKPAHHLFVVRLKPELAANRNAVISAMRRRGVEAYVHYICLSGTEFYRTKYGTSEQQTPVASELSQRGISLPLYPSMDSADVERAVTALREAMDEACN